MSLLIAKVAQYVFTLFIAQLGLLLELIVCLLLDLITEVLVVSPAILQLHLHLLPESLRQELLMLLDTLLLALLLQVGVELSQLLLLSTLQHALLELLSAFPLLQSALVQSELLHGPPLLVLQRGNL